MTFFHWISFICICAVSFSCSSVSEVNQEAVQEKAALQLDAKPLTKIQPKSLLKKGEITEVMVEQVYGLRGENKALLIDTRPPIFFALGHIDGAINVPLKNFSTSYPANQSKITTAVSEGKVLLVYCANQTCIDSHRMASLLAEKGYNSSVFKGGWELWKETGLE